MIHFKEQLSVGRIEAVGLKDGEDRLKARHPVVDFDDYLLDPGPMQGLDTRKDFVLCSFGIDLEQIDSFQLFALDDPGQGI